MKRWVLGTLVAFAGIGALVAVLVPLRSHVSVATPALVLVIPVVAGVAVGGLASGVIAVAAGFVAYDTLFIPPYGTLTVGAGQNWAALVVYAVVMLIVARVVAFLQHTRTQARRDADATRRLYVLSDLLIGDQPVARVLQVIATTIQQEFGGRWAAVMIPGSGPAEQPLTLAATAGEPLTDADVAALSPATGRLQSLHGSVSAGVPYGIVRTALTARGRPVGMVAMAGATLDPHEDELLQTYANQAALALERSQLREQAVRTEMLEQVDRLRDSLMGAVSHDLRTPLASVKAAVTALQQANGNGGLRPDDRKELLDLIEHQSDALDRLVANLLDMTRIQAGALELRCAVTPLVDVVDGGVRASAVRADGVRVALGADLPPVVVDQLLMEQVLANLLDNAARHSPDDVPVEVEATERDGVVELAVSDHGPGVAAADQERIFTMFSRIGGSGRAGLGLAIAKAFVEAHGQAIRVEDAPGGGARFVVSMPTAPVPVDA